MSIVSELKTRFAALDMREQQALRAAACILGLLLLWWVAVQPAWRTLARAPAELDRVEQQLQHMQAQAGEARELRAVPPVSATQAQEALQAATARLGGLAQLSFNGGRAMLTLKGVSSDALQVWLAEARHAARARIVQAQLQRGSVGYLGSITLDLPGATP